MDIFYFVKIFSDWAVYKVFKITPDTLFGNAVNFFIYDSIKIFLLLAVIIFCVSIIRSFLPPEKIRNMLSRKNSYSGYVLAALFGIITPFCTCSAIPLFLGFIEAGVPLGVTFSFLISSPMINEVALVMLWGMFGWKIALTYVFSGLIIAILSGMIIARLKADSLLEDFVLKIRAKPAVSCVKMSWQERAGIAVSYTAGVIKGVWPYILVGIGAGAWIHGYVPVDFLAKYAGSGKWYAVPLSVLIGIPLYSNAAGIMPLVSAMTEKGMSMGSALAFMMAVTGLSMPEFLILKKVMKIKLILIFAGIVGIGIIFTGYLFNIIIR